VSEFVKFSSKIRPDVLDELRRHATRSGRTLASLVDEAVEQYLARELVRPAFRDAAERVLDEHADLLHRLAR
jgi:hypothetical protein